MNKPAIPIIKAMTEGKMNIPTTLPLKNVCAPHNASPPAIAPPMLCEVFQNQGNVLF